MVASARGRGVAALVGLVGASWFLLPAFSFVGTRAPVPRTASIGRRGYRLDYMWLDKKDGDSTLQTMDGYWLGEKGWTKVQDAKGLRYRMRASPSEIKRNDPEAEGVIGQIGPAKFRFGEIFGGTANNKKLRELKKQIFQEGITDKGKIAENEYWLARYGHKRWDAPYVDQSQGNTKEFFPSLAQWSGYDPLNEERGSKWIEADYGKPWLNKYAGVQLPGFVSAAQVAKEYATGKLLPPAK